MQNEKPDIEFSVESQIPVENKGHEEGLSPLKPQQLHFGSTSRTSQDNAIQNHLTPLHLPILVLLQTIQTPPPLPVFPTMMANVPMAGPKDH